MSNIPDSFAREVATRLRELRQRAGLSQFQLAGRLGLTLPSGQGYVSRLEAGKASKAELELVVEFILACEGSVSEFFARMESAGLLAKPAGSKTVAVKPAPIPQRNEKEKPEAEERKKAARTQAAVDRIKEMHRAAATELNRLRKALEPVVNSWNGRLPGMWAQTLYSLVEPFHRTWGLVGRGSPPGAVKAEFERCHRGDIEAREKMGLCREAMDEALAALEAEARSWPE
jgi:transcriptional regulator with XRE-family HTH domain